MPISEPPTPILRRAAVLTLTIASALALAATLECHAALTRAQPNIPLTPSLLYGAVLWLWWSPIAFTLWHFGTARPWLLRLSFRAVVAQVGCGVALSAIHLGVLTWTVHALARAWPQLWAAGYNTLVYFTMERFGFECAIYAILWACCAALASERRAHLQGMHALALREQLAAAQLHALQMQLEPHFLFNTLNAVSALVDLGRNREASSMLAHVDTLLRSGLSRSAPEKVPLTEELRVIESYLAIQHVRFYDRLQVTIHASSEAMTGLVPCFLLQPIVENAIQHGIAPCKHGGHIQATVRRMGDRLWLQVVDNGAGASDATSGHGIGLRNTQERLRFFYPEAHHFAAEALATGGFAVTMEIPYEEAAA